MLLDARTEKDEQVWWSAEETSVYATGPSAAVETTGLAVQALLQSGEASGTARKALAYIASKKDAYGTWGTTQATIMALRALLTATEKGAADVRGTVVVLLNGKPAEKLELTPENNDLLHQFVFKNVNTQTAPRRLVSSSRGRAVLPIRSWEAITCLGMKKRRESHFRSTLPMTAHAWRRTTLPPRAQSSETTCRKRPTW